MRITLSTGRVVELTAYHRCQTYGGVLEGLPEVEEMIQSAQRTLETLWGNGRPTYVVPPRLTPGRPIPEGSPARRRHKDGRWPDRLPPACHLAWLGSSALKDGHGSHLFVIYWTEDRDEPLSTLLYEALHSVDWDVHAADYWE